MICNRCLRAASRHTDGSRVTAGAFLARLRPLSTSARLSSTSISPSPATQASSRPAPPSSPHQPPAATSTSAAQPFSEPMTPATPKVKKDKTSKIPKSSVAAGTRLKGLNFIKGKEDPVAMADEEYPAWLWTLLPDKSSSGAAGGDLEGDLYAKSAKQRRKAAKALRKRDALLAGRQTEKPVPIEEQSVDLPLGQSSAEAGEARASVTRALRQKRRASIKEANFLKGVS